MPARCEGDVRALRIQELADATIRTGDAGNATPRAKIADRASRARTRGHFADAGARDASRRRRSRRPGAAPLRNRARRRPRSSAGSQAIERAELVCFDTETTSIDPMQAKIVGLSFAIEPGVACYIPLAHRYPGAADQLPLDATLARLAPWFADPRRAKSSARTSSTTSTCSRTTGLVLDGVAHDTLLAVLRARGAPAARHGQPRVAPSQRQDDQPTPRSPARARSRSSFDQVEHRRRDRAIRPRTPTSRCSSIAICIRASPPIPKLDHVYAAIEMPVREVLFEMERDGVMLDAALLRRAEPRARREGDGAGAARRIELAGQPFNLALAEAARRDPVRAR